MDRTERLRSARLYVVTPIRPDLAEFLDAILGAGVDIVQLRDKGADARRLLDVAAVFRDAARRHGALFIVNDRPDVALATEADGVHLGQDDLPPQVARGILGPDAIVGLSCHRPEDYEHVTAEVDYVTAGPVHETPTKPGRPGVGLELVRHAAQPRVPDEGQHRQRSQAQRVVEARPRPPARHIRQRRERPHLVVQRRQFV